MKLCLKLFLALILFFFIIFIGKKWVYTAI